MQGGKQIWEWLRLSELIQEAGHTLQRSPALSLCLCFVLAYLPHSLFPSPYWLYIELGLIALILLSYIWLVHRVRRGQVGYGASISGYLALTLLCTTLWGMRIDSAQSTNTYLRHSSPLDVAEVLRQRLEETRISPQVSAMLSGLSLGDIPKTVEGKSIREQFILSGMAHLLSVSGFHLGVVAGMLHILLMRLPIGRNGRCGRSLVILGTWGFVALTGWAIPTVRAALMLSLYLIGRIIYRPIRFSQILALSAVVQLIYDPHIASSWSFSLSYAAVTSIYILYPKIFALFGSVKQPLLRYLWSAFSITLAAQVGVLPLCFYYFGKVSWSFIWLSLPASLLAVMLIPLTLLFILCSMWSVSLAFLPYLGSLLGFLGSQMLALVDLGSRTTSLHQVGTWPLWLVLVWWLAILVYSIYDKLPASPNKNSPSLLEILR